MAHMDAIEKVEKRFIRAVEKASRELDVVVKTKLPIKTEETAGDLIGFVQSPRSFRSFQILVKSIQTQLLISKKVL